MTLHMRGVEKENKKYLYSRREWMDEWQQVTRSIRVCGFVCGRLLLLLHELRA